MGLSGGAEQKHSLTAFLEELGDIAAELTEPEAAGFIDELVRLEEQEHRLEELLLPPEPLPGTEVLELASHLADATAKAVKGGLPPYKFAKLLLLFARCSVPREVKTGHPVLVALGNKRALQVLMGATARRLGSNYARWWAMEVAEAFREAPKQVDQLLADDEHRVGNHVDIPPRWVTWRDATQHHDLGPLALAEAVVSALTEEDAAADTPAYSGPAELDQSSQAEASHADDGSEPSFSPQPPRRSAIRDRGEWAEPFLKQLLHELGTMDMETQRAQAPGSGSSATAGASRGPASLSAWSCYIAFGCGVRSLTLATAAADELEQNLMAVAVMHRQGTSAPEVDAYYEDLAKVARLGIVWWHIWPKMTSPPGPESGDSPACLQALSRALFGCFAGGYAAPGDLTPELHERWRETFYRLLATRLERAVLLPFMAYREWADGPHRPELADSLWDALRYHDVGFLPMTGYSPLSIAVAMRAMSRVRGRDSFDLFKTYFPQEWHKLPILARDVLTFLAAGRERGLEAALTQGRAFLEPMLSDKAREAINDRKAFTQACIDVLCTYLNAALEQDVASAPEESQHYVLGQRIRAAAGLLGLCEYGHDEIGPDACSELGDALDKARELVNEFASAKETWQGQLVAESIRHAAWKEGAALLKKLAGGEGS